MRPNLGAIRHTVVCRQPRKPETADTSQECYLREVQSSLFQPIVALKLLGSFLSNLYILVRPYTVQRETFTKGNFDESSLQQL